MKRRKTQKRSWVVVVWVVVLLAVLSIPLGYQLLVTPSPSPVRQDKPAASPPSPVSLRLMGPFGPAFAGEMLAQRAGLFDREGLQMTLRAGASANDPISAVLAGTETFGLTRADSFLIARSKDAPIVAFAAGYIESNAAFYVLKQSNIHSPQDFPGHRLGRRAGDDTAFIYDAMAQRLALPRSNITEVPVAFEIGMLTSGHVDIWPGHVADEDWELAKRGLDYIAINPASYGIHIAGSVYFAREATIAAHPELVQRFLNALIGGWDRVYTDYTNSIPKIISFDPSGLSADYIRFALDRQREYLRPIAARVGEFSTAQWRSLQAILLAQRLIGQTIDLSTAVSYEFLQETYRKPLTFGR